MFKKIKIKRNLIFFLIRSIKYLLKTNIKQKLMNFNIIENQHTKNKITNISLTLKIIIKNN
jgi:hypothetical protein